MWWTAPPQAAFGQSEAVSYSNLSCRVLICHIKAAGGQLLSQNPPHIC